MRNQSQTSSRIPQSSAANLTKDDVARYLGVSKDKVNRMICQKQIRHYKVGPLVRFNLECLHEYLERQRVEAR